MQSRKISVPNLLIFCLPAESSQDDPSNDQLSKLGLPEVYDKKHRINVQLKTDDLCKLLKDALKDASKSKSMPVTMNQFEFDYYVITLWSWSSSCLNFQNANKS